MTPPRLPTLGSVASARDFAVEVEDDGHGSTLVKVSGELDLATSSQLDAALESTSADGKVVIDLTECEFLDSSAIRSLLAGAARSESAGGSLSLVAPDQRIRRVLEIANVEAKVPIHATRDAAL
jgi:anti-anti-sigma factor